MAARKKNKDRKKRKKTARIGVASKKKLTKKKPAPNRKPSRKKTLAKKKRLRGRGEVVDTVVFEPRGEGARSGGQSGDLQGLSGIEGAASESVKELLEEGNAFEADVVKGVEDAEASDEGEVVTHEVPEDDVPKEYLEEK
jgi:hypothetical protein